MSKLLNFLLLALLAAACGDDPAGGVVLAQPADSKEVFGEVRSFRFEDQAGQPVTLQSLQGHAWAVCFVFTRCSGPCPKVTGTMKRLQAELKDSDVRLVSVSVDPQWDTPAVLAQYAQSFGADTRRWWFLTGDEAATDEWIRASFLSGVARDPAAPAGERVTHRTSICAVDKQGRVRGFYAGETAEDLDKLRQRLEWLQQE